MKDKMKAVAVLVAAVMCAAVGYAGHKGHRPGPRPAVRMVKPPPHHHVHGHHHHKKSVWGRGGSNFLPGFVGGVVGGLVADAVVTPREKVVVTTPAVVVTPPVVVAQPAPVVVQPVPSYTTQNVWVEGRYIDQVQPNGTVVRVWQPGHYELRQVLVQ